MKKCTYCGKEYPDDVVKCAIDDYPVYELDPRGVPVPPVVPPPLPAIAKKSPDGRYLKYEDVPWYRREPGAIAFIGVLFCGLVSTALCIICLTGDVYKNSYDRDGKLKVWSRGNKVAAVLILVLQALLYWVYLKAKSYNISRP